MLQTFTALTQATVSEQDVVTPFEQNLLVALVFVIMFGLGAGLTPKDFVLAFKRPWGVVIGWVTQFGIMPFLAYILAATLLFQLPVEYAAPVAVGAAAIRESTHARNRAPGRAGFAQGASRRCETDARRTPWRR